MKASLIFCSRRFLALAGAVFLAVSTLRAQLVSDGATNTLSNTTNTITGNVTVGTNGSFTLLVLSTNCLLTNSGFSTIGQNATARSNEVRLVSSTARWQMGGNLFVGSNGVGNRLVVSNGALVAPNSVLIGNSVNSGNNEVVVSGLGSTLAFLNEIYVGLNGNANRLTTLNGGLVFGSSMVIGNGSVSNSALVAGQASRWFLNNDLWVGPGRGNSLVVSNRGFVNSVNGHLGGTVTASNNLVRVTGAGSTWSNSADLRIGDTGHGNQLLVSDGGAVWSRHGYVGSSSALASNNLASITGAGSVWSNALDLEIGTFGANNQLIVSNGATVFAAGNGLIGTGTNANGNAVTLTDAGTHWWIGTNLYVGSNGSMNRLIVDNGAFLGSSSVKIGNHSGSSNNEALVTGPGSTLNSPSGLWIGADGNSNRLTILQGGKIFATDSGGLTIIGFNQGMRGNAALVADPGSRWSLNHTLFVGSGANANTLVVSNGALVDSLNATIGSALTASNNLVMVTGGGSTWSNSSTLRVGDIGPGSQLIVSNGGSVFVGGSAFVGVNSFSTGNRLTVDGGTLRVTNAAGTGVLDVRRGTNVLNAGLVEVDRLLVTNTAGIFEFNGGTLSVKNSTINNGKSFQVGNGSSPTTWILAGNGTHNFPNALVIEEQGLLTGNGIINGSLNLFGTLSPGLPIGKIILSSSGPGISPESTTFFMEISKSGLLLTNDVLQSAASVGYGGSLIVSNLSPGPLVAGDRFKLFEATNYVGSFSSLTLPQLNPHLVWTNKLLVDGSIEVVERGSVVFVTARPSPVGMGPNPDGTYFEFMPLADSTARSLVADAPPREGSRAYLSSTNFTDTNAGFIVMPTLSVPGAVYRLDHTFTSGAGNINTDAVLSVSCTNATLSVSNTDKFQAQYGANTWSTIGYVTNNAHVSTPRIEFRYQSGLINGGISNKRLDVDCFRFTTVVPRVQVLSASVAGTNLVINGFDGLPDSSYAVLTSTNIALPITNWIPVATNQFDGIGNFIFSNAISPSELQRYFRIRLP